METREDAGDADDADGGVGGDGGVIPGLLLHEAPPPQDPTHPHRGRT